MIIHYRGGTMQTATPELAMRCPACRREGTFDVLGDGRWVKTTDADLWLGTKTCPNTECRAQVFAVMNRQHDIVTTYPAETIDFDATDLPPNVIAALEEAVTCHAARCYTAAAMLVRKTLEEVCQDQGAEGTNLHGRIESLSTKIVMPQGMSEALHNLRLLGNDAAHVESKDYDDVGEEEVEVALDVTKEILKATYQLKAIMGRLEALKKARLTTSDS